MVRNIILVMKPFFLKQTKYSFLGVSKVDTKDTLLSWYCRKMEIYILQKFQRTIFNLFYL